MFDLTVQWLIVIVDISVKALVLAAIAMLGLRLLKIQDSNLRHRTWTGVLIGMLLLPVLSRTLPNLQLPVAVPEHWKIYQSDVARLSTVSIDTENTKRVPVGILQEPSSSLADHESSEESGFYRSKLINEAELGSSNLSLEMNDEFHPAAAELDSENIEIAAMAPSLTFQNPRTPLWLGSLFAIWLAGASVMLLKLLVGVVYSFRLARSSKAITSNDLVKLDSTICECPLIRVPVALGVIRPKVLLPSNWNTWSAEKLQSVIAHEQTHIQRADCAVIFLAEVNRCLYWFHPVAWWLRSRLGQLAETACDDAAIDCTGDRAMYARYLLEFASTASSHRGRLTSVGISMARPSHVETRIIAILDFTRPLTKRLTWTTTLLLFGALVPLITLAAAVQPATQTEAQSFAEAPATDVGNPEVATLKSPVEKPLIDNDFSVANREFSTELLSYSGRVETPNGDPVVGAKIWLAVTSHVFNSEANRENREGLLRELGTSDEQGQFEIVLDEVTTQEIRKRVHFSKAHLVATAQGRGLDWMPLDVFQDNPTPSEKRDSLKTRIDRALGDGRFTGRALKLRPESQPVQGRLVDLEGHPLPDVKVLVESLHQPDIPRLLNAFEKSWKQEFNAAMSVTAVGVGGLARTELQKLIPSVTTDDNGEFELRGIGDDQLVTLVFASDRIESRPLNVFGREMETVNLPHSDSYPAGVKDVFTGRKFTYAVGPSIPVEGVVTDYDTGKPVANVLVYVERLFEKRGRNPHLRLDSCHMRAVTDEQGRFRITGMPPGEGHVIEVVPAMSEPYLMTSKVVSPSLNDGDVKRIELQVKRGIWIDGHVTDKQSGEPIMATVDYFALKKNPNSLDKLGLEHAWIQQRYRTNSDGQYRVLGLPGPGVLLVKSLARGYPLAAGAGTIDSYETSGGVILTAAFPLPVSQWHLLQQIDPANDVIPFTSDLVLDSGISIPGRVIGPDEKPISDLYVLGQTERDEYWSPRYANKVPTNDRFTVNGYDGKGPRQLFFKNKDESLVGQYRLAGAVPKEIVVKLQPSVQVLGRLIDKKTDIPAARYFVLCENCLLANKEHPPVKFQIHWLHTDDEGRFEIKGLMPGLKYKMNAFDRSKGIDNRFTIDLTSAQPGEVIQLGDVDSPNSEDNSND